MRLPHDPRGRGFASVLVAGLLVAAGCGGVDEVRPVSCDPVADTGCPSGEHCRLDGRGATLCLSPASPPEGAVCGSGSCGAGEACVRVEGHLACRPLCELDAADGACEAGARCAYALTERIGVCVAPCDPFPGDGAEPCPGGTCAPVPDLPYPICVATGGARLDEPCTSKRCARSLGCLSAADGTRCRALCEPGRDDHCPSPLRCGGEVARADLGYCTAPPP
jgi:hypothetical protein